MTDWLLSSIDPGRGHDIGLGLSWHARLMVLSWGILCPAAILAARYFKIMPGQDWPRELDNATWWHCHRIGQGLVCLLSVPALLLAWFAPQTDANLHRLLGFTVLGLGVVQLVGGLSRGCKGGPTDPSGMSGDHFDMTARRQMFEKLHRGFGYAVLPLMVLAIVTGLWAANAPRWMWLVLVSYWILLGCLAGRWQRMGRAFDTYQAIWGPDPGFPGNQLAKSGWATVRPGDRTKKGTD